jgi:hypothetical protein
MIKLSVYSFMLGSIFLISASALSSDPDAKKSNPFGKRMQHAHEKKEEEKTLYPKVFDAKQIGEIVNADIVPYKSGKGDKREAVPLYDESLGQIKVSCKVDNSILNQIKAEIDEGFLDGKTDRLRINDSKYGTTCITVHPDIIAKFSQVSHPVYQGSTAQEETKKTGQPMKGMIVEYILERNGTPIRYYAPLSEQQTTAKLFVSVTSKK